MFSSNPNVQKLGDQLYESADEASVLCSVFCKIDIDLFIYHVQLAPKTLFALQIDRCNI